MNREHTHARIGGNNPPENTGKFIAAKFEHDSARPIDGYAAPQLHPHAVIFNVTEQSDGSTRALQERPFFESKQFATAVYQSELMYGLRDLGYEIEPRARRNGTGAYLALPQSAFYPGDNAWNAARAALMGALNRKAELTRNESGKRASQTWKHVANASGHSASAVCKIRVRGAGDAFASQSHTKP